MDSEEEDDQACPDCGGHGTYFGHAPNCDSDNCALAGGIDDCNGLVVSCHCEAAPGQSNE